MVMRGLFSPSFSSCSLRLLSLVSSSEQELRNECAGDRREGGGGEQRGDARGRSGVKSCVKVLNGIGVGIETEDVDIDANVDVDVLLFLLESMSFPGGCS